LAPQNLNGFLFSLYSAGSGHFATEKTEKITLFTALKIRFLLPLLWGLDSEILACFSFSGANLFP